MYTRLCAALARLCLRVGVGGLVLIGETRPLSATKRWRLKDIVEKAK